MSPDMDCPGCDKTGVSQAMVACFSCWHRMPQAIKMPIRNTSPGGIARMRAIAAARKWLKENRK